MTITTEQFNLLPEELQAYFVQGCFHPTVKPVKLLSYFVTLFSRPGDTVLDPFVGSGTTCLAAKQLDRQYMGIEREAEYVKIAEARIKAINKVQQELL